MKFQNLVFDKVGCCGTHSWAEVVDENGIKKQIFENEDGTYDVSQFSGQLLMRHVTGLDRSAVATLLG